MKSFDKGVSWYTIGTVHISFPEDEVCCYYCPMLGIELKSDRAYCRLTGEYLTAPKHIKGFNCPIIFNYLKESENNEPDSI